MTIKVEDSRNQVVAGASVGPFSINFVFENASDVLVYRNDILLDSSAYTIVGAGIDPAPDTRTVTLNAAATAGDIITPMRNMNYDRTTDFTIGGEFSAENINKEFDRMVLMMQQLRTDLAELGLQYPNYVDDSNGKTINALPVLPNKTATTIPIWSSTTDGSLVASTIDQNADASDLESRLANADSGTDGARMIGYRNKAGIASDVEATLSTLESNSITGFVTGMLIPYCQTTPPAGWVSLNDGTIGNASSGASTRANADTEALYTMLWETSNAEVPGYIPIYDSVGAPTTRGASAAADFAANKMLSLPRAYQRSIVPGLGVAASYSSTFTIASAGTTFLTLTLTGAESAGEVFVPGTTVQVSTTGTLPNPLLVSTDYYVAAGSGNTIQLVATASDYVTNPPTPITITTTGTGTHTVTASRTARGVFAIHGQETNLTNIEQLPAHTHDYTTPSTVSYATLHNAPGFVDQTTTATTTSTGGNIPTSLMNPTIHIPWIIKL